MLSFLFFPNLIKFLRSYEPSGDFDFSFLANDMWLIMITMTTVGLGEGYPSTHLGRFIGVCACLIGMLLVSSMVVSMTMSSEFTQEENKVLIFSWDLISFNLQGIFHT